MLEKLHRLFTCVFFLIATCEGLYEVLAYYQWQERNAKWLLRELQRCRKPKGTK